MASLCPRLQQLRADVMQRRGSFAPDINPCLTYVAAWKARDMLSSGQRRAEILYRLVEASKYEVRPGWSICGEHLAMGYPPWPDTPEKEAACLAEYNLSPEQAEGIKHPKPWICYHSDFCCTLTDDLQKGMGFWVDCEDAKTRKPDMVYWGFGWMENHSVRGFATAMAKGFEGLRDEIEARLTSTDIADPDFPRRENYWRSAMRVCDAGMLLGKRYSQAARDAAAGQTDPEEKARLDTIAQTCETVTRRGAKTFYEAVQMLWLTHVLSCGNDGINANSIGRLDQFLWPYYQADLQAGRLSRHEATELMIELALKLYLEYDVQAITLGGCDKEGRCAVNELSYIILDATEAVDFVRDLCVRIDSNTPKEFLERSCELIVKGGGIPFLFNDECFLPALTERGIELEDARDYAPIGCVELTIPGKANPHAVSGWFNTTKCLEFALNNGRTFETNAQVGPRTGEFAEFKTYDDFYRAYQTQVDFFARRMAYNINRGELYQQQNGPLAMWSLLTDDCIERGRDITDGGAKYNYHSICLLGVPNTADSLYAIKTLCFGDKSLPAEELLSALRANFDGHEPLRQKLLHLPKYGNDEMAVDAIAGEISNEFIALMDTMKSPLNGKYFVHLFSFLCNLTFGRQLWATPDGRKAGEPLAYSLSAVQGRDRKGVTAMLNSLANMPHNKAAGGSAAIIEIDPKVVEGPNGPTLLAEIIRGAFQMGVGQLQWNVVTAERLRQAQKDPENFGNISVRVAGFSQMFKLLGPSLQEHIIRRTKHNG